MTNDDLIFRHRVRLFARAQEVGVRRACRELGFHHSTYYRWKPFVERHGLEILRPRERRAPRMPNQLPPFLEEKILAFALAHTGTGPRQIAAALGQERWGSLRISHNGVYRVLRRHGLGTRRRRLALVAGYQSPPEPERRELPAELHLEAELPGALVQLDCFHIGRLAGTKGRVWQYTATDVHSGYLWGELHVTPLNPAARHTSALVRRVGRELAAAGWELKAVSTDNAASSEPPSSDRQPPRPVRATASSMPDGRSPTAPSSACSGRSSRNAGDRPSRARSCRSSPRCGATSSATYATSTSSVRTLAGTRRAACPPTSSLVRGKSDRDEPNVSAHLGGGAV
jgi:hypothetical protein